MANTAGAPTPPSHLRGPPGHLWVLPQHRGSPRSPQGAGVPGPAAGLREVDPGQLVLPLRGTCLLPREKGRVQLKAEEAGRAGPQEGMEDS